MKTVYSLPLAAVLSFGAGLAFATEATKPTVKADKSMKTVAATGAAAATGTASASRAATRDWADVDTNRDNLVSPEEMEAYLAANTGTSKSK